MKKKNRNFSGKDTLAFLEMLVALLENGFSLKESMAVMERSGQFTDFLMSNIQEKLILGESLEQTFSSLKLSNGERNQIRLAESHGNIPITLHSIVEYQKGRKIQKQMLQKVLIYPLLLLFFVISVLLGMRFFLLPQLLASGMIDVTHWGIRFIQESPYYFLGGLLLFCLLALLIYQYSKRKTALEMAVLLGKMPLIGEIYSRFQTSYFALEWARLFQQGLEIRQIIVCMLEAKEGTLMKLLAQDLEQSFAQGHSLGEKMRDYSFLTPEFPIIIFQGEVKGKLGDELMIYSQILMKNVFQKIERSIQWIQPLIFLFVALLIVGIYGAMFLPIYGNIQGVIE